MEGTNTIVPYKDYQILWDTMVVNPIKANLVNIEARHISANKDRYIKVIAELKKKAPLSAVPWPFIGLVHKMECDLSFDHHLHNGDPLVRRTTHVPAGRPIASPINTGKGYTFEESAVDALMFQGLHKITNWTIPFMLWKFEEYNGIGYRKYHNMNSPYLWSFTNHYTKGKYTSDGTFNPSIVSTQVGVAPILKVLWPLA